MHVRSCSLMLILLERNGTSNVRMLELAKSNRRILRYFLPTKKLLLIILHWMTMCRKNLLHQMKLQHHLDCNYVLTKIGG